jgi:hypothetical protein
MILIETTTRAQVRPYKVGDAIWYSGVLHSVHSFGLLWTHLYRFDGSRLSVRPPRARHGAVAGTVELAAMPCAHALQTSAYMRGRAIARHSRH